jgi:type II secretory pathway pseudopilin PulG
MVALVISGIVAGVVFDLILGQTRFARYQNAREEVQQNARAALEVISAELRGVPPAAIVTAEPTKIRFRLPRAWGVLCNIITADTTRVWVRFPANGFPADIPASPMPSGWGIAIAQTENAAVVPLKWSFPVEGASLSGGSPCSNNDRLQPAAAGVAVERGFSGIGLITEANVNTVPIGTPVFVWQEIEYDMSTSNIPGIWIRRNSQPMAGPVPGNDGLQFTYVDVNGDPTGNVNAIASIRLEVRTESRAKFKDTPQTQTARTEIYLRNRN